MTVDQAAQPRLDIVPLSLAEANEFIQKHHRHHGILRFQNFQSGRSTNQTCCEASPSSDGRWRGIETMAALQRSDD